MMSASMEEGREPLAQPAEYSALVGRVLKLQNVFRALLVLDVLVAPLVLLAPFNFSTSAWSESQVQNWSLDSSIWDFELVAVLRDAIVIAVLEWGRRQRKNEAAARLSRRASVVSLLLGVARVALLDWQLPKADAICVPTVVWAAISAPVVAIVAQLLLMASAKQSAAEEAAQPNGNAEESGSPQYSNSMTFRGTVKLMKPYFWPSTGDSCEIFLNRTRAMLTWVFVTLSKVFNIIAPIYLAAATNAIAKAINSGKHEITRDIWLPLVWYSLLTFLSKALKEAQSLIYIKVQQAAYIEIADTTFAHLHSLSLDWHLKKKLGNVVRSMDRGIAAAQQTMQYVFLYLVPTLVEAFAVVLIFVFHFENLRLAVFVGLNLFLYIYVTIKVTLWRKGFRAASTQKDNELHDRLTDSLINYETIKYFAAEPYERREYRSVVEKFQKFSMSVQASLSILNVGQQMIINFTLAGGMILSAVQVVQDPNPNLGNFVAINAYIINVFTPLSFLGTIYNMVISALVDMRSFGQLLAETAEIVDKQGAPELDTTVKNGQAMVEFRKVSFNYAKQPLMRSVKEVSFQVKRGGSMALVGTTGAGKTTITRLLFRFYDVMAGQVLVNSQDVRTVTQRSLRSAIGMVPQDVVLFNSTVEHNLRYGNIENATQEDIEKAAVNAQLDVFIKQQPDGYKTVVGERGLKLSGGEKQRLAIARCLVKDPPIVLLDEATSALDSQTEQRVQQALNTLSNSRTVITIAHRLSTIRHYDEIVVLEAGQVVERGSHDDLMATPGSRYSAMWQRQADGLMDDPPAPSSEAPSTGGAGLGLSKVANGK